MALTSRRTLVVRRRVGTLALLASLPANAFALKLAEPALAPCDSRAGAPATERARTGDGVSSIGITYFAGRSKTGDDDHLASALTTELVAQLRGALPLTNAGAPAARSAPKAVTVRLSNGGVFTDVDLALTGTVLRDQSVIRTDVRVTRTSDGSVVWASTAARPLRELPALARQLAQGLANKIGVRLTAPAPTPLPARMSDAEYELLLRGTNARAGYDPGSLSRAIDYFDEAKRLDPTSADVERKREAAAVRLLAWGGTGAAREARFAASGLFARILDRPRDEAEQLVDQADAEIRAGNLAQACTLLDRAVAVDPRSAPAFALRALARARSGSVRDAFADAETVTQLGRPVWGNALRAVVLRRSGNAGDAKAQLTRVLSAAHAVQGALAYWDARFSALALAESGRRSEARKLLSRVDERDPRRQPLLRDAVFQGADRAVSRSVE